MTSSIEQSELASKSMDSLLSLPHSRIYLMSTTVAHHVAGMYNLNQSLLLSRNEVCRREFARLSRALQSFDCLKKPWKALALQRWLSEYFLLMVNLFERQKKTFIFDRFKSLGYEIPVDLQYNEDILHLNITTIAQLASEVCSLSLATTSRFSPHKLLDLSNQLKEEIAHFKVFMESHYELEEAYWPEKLHMEGKDESFQILSKMAMELRDNAEPVIGDLCMASILFTAGYMQRQVTSNTDIFDLPWCEPRTCTELVKTLPYVIKVVPFMHQVSRLLHYRKMITSVSQSEDSLELLSQYRQEQMERLIGCGGWLNIAFDWMRTSHNPNDNSVKQTFDKVFLSMKRVPADQNCIAPRFSSKKHGTCDNVLSLSASVASISSKKCKPSCQAQQPLQQHGLRSVSVDSLSGREPSWKFPNSPPSPECSSGKYSNKVLPAVSQIPPQSQNGKKGPNFLSPRFLAMVSRSGSTDTADSLPSRSSYASAQLHHSAASNINYHNNHTSTQHHAFGMIPLGSVSMSP